MSLYGPLNTAALVTLVIYNLLQYKEKKNLLGGVSHSAIGYFAGKEQRGIIKLLSSVALWTILEIILISAAQFYWVGYANSLFGKLVNTGANYYGLMLASPLLVFLFCLLLKIDPLAQMDLVTPAFPAALVFTKLACFSAGCCRGFAWEYGFYNPVSGLTEFPAQLLEAAAALLLFPFMLYCKKRAKKGTMFPIYLMVYSAVRFFTEYTRCEPRIFMGLKTYQLLCIGGVLLGALEYFLVTRYNARAEKKVQLEAKEDGVEIPVGR